MKRLITQIVVAVFLSVPLQAQPTDLINVAALQSGSFMVETPPSYSGTNLMSGSVGEYTPEALFDLGPKFWCSESGASFPHVFVLELTEPCTIEELTFNNICEEYEGISARDVRVEFADDPSAPLWRSAGEFRLPERRESRFPITPTGARMIRISILSNYGNESYTELAEFGALGRAVTPEIRPVNVEGEWETNWGPVRFVQNGTSVSGDYDYHEGVILYGGVNRNQITYKWIEADYGLEGWTLLFMNREGTRLTGVWCHGTDWTEYGFWIMEREKGHPFVPVAGADEPGPGLAAGSHTVSDEVVRQMERTLDREERLVLYGINFATNSAEITDESFNLLDHVARLLEGQPDLRIRIEGHTDGVGSDEANLKLSHDRAASVRDYLVSGHGIDAGRLSIRGMGEGSPIAGNDTEAGRGANRRVEIYPEK